MLARAPQLTATTIWTPDLDTLFPYKLHGQNVSDRGESDREDAAAAAPEDQVRRLATLLLQPHSRQPCAASSRRGYGSGKLSVACNHALLCLAANKSGRARPCTQPCSNRHPKPSHSHPPHQGKRLRSFRTRTLSTFAMIFSFTGIIYLGHVPLVLLVFTLQARRGCAARRSGRAGCQRGRGGSGGRLQ